MKNLTARWETDLEREKAQPEQVLNRFLLPSRFRRGGRGICC
jgi:hypothetical protein